MIDYVIYNVATRVLIRGLLNTLSCTHISFLAFILILILGNYIKKVIKSVALT